MSMSYYFILVFFQGDGLCVDHFFAFVVFFWFVVKDVWIRTLSADVASLSDRFLIVNSVYFI